MNLYSKAGFTVRSAVVSPNGRGGVIYECEYDMCGEVYYVGEMERSLGQRAKEHAKFIEKEH